MVELKKEVRRIGVGGQPEISDYSPWTMDRFNNVGPAASVGDFSELANICRWLRKDGRVASCLLQRHGTFARATLRVSSSSPAAVKQFRQDFRTCVPVKALKEITDSLKFEGMSVNQILRGPHDLPVLEPWDLQFISNLDGWKAEVAKGAADSFGNATEKIDIAWGKKWIKLTAATASPWATAGWRVLGPYVIGKIGAWVDWLRASMHEGISPVMVQTQGDTFEGKDRFFADLDMLGQLTYVEMPFNVSMKRLESVTRAYKTMQDLIQEADKDIAEFLLGQSTTTRLEGGSYNAAEVLLEVSEEIVETELQVLAQELNTHFVPLWQEARRITADLEIGWEVESQKQAQQVAATFERVANAIDKLKESPLAEQIDWTAFAKKMGIPLIGEE